MCLGYSQKLCNLFWVLHFRPRCIFALTQSRQCPQSTIGNATCKWQATLRNGGVVSVVWGWISGVVRATVSRGVVASAAFVDSELSAHKTPTAHLAHYEKEKRYDTPNEPQKQVPEIQGQSRANFARAISEVFAAWEKHKPRLSSKASYLDRRP